MDTFVLDRLADAANFDEQAYLDENPDVARAVREGTMPSGHEHFRIFGFQERRRIRAPFPELLPLKRQKLQKIHALLRDDLPHRDLDGMVDYLSPELRNRAAIHDTGAVSGFVYDKYATDLIARYSDRWILDCGAGRRPVYYSNVVNLEIVEYDSTDVLGIAEELPFRDACFDAVFSFSVLEHVRDPFRCAAEIGRVLKPGGELLCAVPFLQPLHGYPSHYYNMSGPGIRNLFEGTFTIEDHFVPESGLPIWTLTWFLNSWAEGLPPEAKKDFLEMRVQDLIGDPMSYIKVPFVRELRPGKNWELASTTFLRARKT